MVCESSHMATAYNLGEGIQIDTSLLMMRRA